MQVSVVGDLHGQLMDLQEVWQLARVCLCA